MIIDTKAPDAEQFCELGTKYSVNEQEQDEWVSLFKYLFEAYDLGTSAFLSFGHL